MYDDRTGLSHWIVSDVLQDRQGFIWISTWNGLNRFDGYAFRQIKSQPGDGTNIQSAVIRQIYLDQKGDIICFTANDSYKFDTKKYQLVNWSDSRKHRIAPNRQPKQLKDREGNIWQVQRYGIKKSSRAVYPAKLITGTDDVQARAFMREGQQRWWLATKEDESIRIFETDNHRAGNGSNHRLIGFLGKDGKIHGDNTPFGYRAYCMTQLSNGDIWIGCKPGALLRLRQQPDGSYDIERIKADGLVCDVVYHMAEDHRGRLWLATFGGGAMCVPRPADAKPACINFAGDKAFANGSEKVRRIMLMHHNQIVCATTGGLVVGNIDEHDLTKSSFRRLTRDGKRAESLSCNALMDVTCDKKGRIFIATENNGIDMTTWEQLNSPQPTFRHFNQQNTALMSDACLALTVKDDGRLFVVCSDQVADFNPDDLSANTYSRRFWNASCHFSEERAMLLPDGSWLFGQEQGAFIATQHALQSRGALPPLVFTELSVDGHSVDYGVCRQDTITIGTDQRNFTIAFAALDYTDNSGIRYRFHLGNTPWSQATKERTLTFHNIRPGDYKLTVQSTDRYGRWVENTRQLVIHVTPHWYETLWARILGWVLMAGVITAIVYFFFYVRQLNRQRRELLEKYMELIAAKRNREETTETDQLGESVLTSLPDDDHKFMEHVMQYIEENLSNSDANIHDMASAAATSNSNLNRKLRSLIGITAAQLLIDARMRKAHDLLTDKSVRKINIADVAYRCGYADPKYFSRCYKQKHGVTPSEEIARRSNTDFS